RVHNRAGLRPAGPEVDRVETQRGATLAGERLRRVRCERKDLNLHGVNPLEPESSASANSATLAIGRRFVLPAAHGVKPERGGCAEQPPRQSASAPRALDNARQ